MMKTITMTMFVALLISLGSLAQTDVQKTNRVPIYRITVVARTIKAINYRHRSASTKVEFRGTSLMPQARGTAEVASKQGAIHIIAELKHLQPASEFGPEYLTYVLWAISPEGRPLNLGEVLLNNEGNSKLNVTSDLQSFGLIVTAEPYFAVTQPSDVVVMENFVTGETRGTIEEVEAKYELLQRGQYTTNANPSEVQAMMRDARTPLELDEARNAVRIAKWIGADQYASDTLKKAELDLQNAEDLLRRKKDKKGLITDAREAAQTAEDARVITIKKIEAEEKAREQQAAADAQARAQTEAAAAAQAKEQAERAAKEKAEADAGKATAQAQEAQAELEAARAKQAEQQAQQQTQEAQQQAQRAEREKAELRARLLKQLNEILQTRDSQRGLIVTMSDVLFDTGKYTLHSEAREKLAKVSGVLLAYPGLTLEVDGYTDNVGSDQLNQTLSEERANAVRDYLAQQGVPAGSITTKGFGKTNPVATNDTAVGRQLNRRVELVVSGEAIGIGAVSSNE